MRLFVALDLSEGQKDYLRSLQNSLKRKQVSGRWVNPDIIHLTLQFLGEVESEEVPVLCTAIRKALAQAESFRFSLGSLRWFGNPHRPRVLWMKIEDGYEQIIALQCMIEAELAALGFKPDKLFEPHVTIARNPDMGGLDLAAFSLEESCAALAADTGSICDNVVLYSSHLAKEGPTYEAMEKFKLRAGGVA